MVTTFWSRFATIPFLYTEAMGKETTETINLHSFYHNERFSARPTFLSWVAFVEWHNESLSFSLSLSLSLSHSLSSLSLSLFPFIQRRRINSKEKRHKRAGWGKKKCIQASFFLLLRRKKNGDILWTGLPRLHFPASSNFRLPQQLSFWGESTIPLSLALNRVISIRFFSLADRFKYVP